MRMELLQLGRGAWGSFEAGASLEWLETNGIGGWAYGTVANANTRFYHGLLAAALNPPTGRHMLLARLEEQLQVGDQRYHLYANRWATGHVEAEGLSYLHSFALAPFPTWTYVAGDVLLTKQIFMQHGANRTLVRYRLQRMGGKGPVSLILSPLATCRSIHAVQLQTEWPFGVQQHSPDAVTIQAYPGAPCLHLAAGGALWRPVGEWVTGLYLPYEELRGEATREDLYLPGRFVWELTGDDDLTFVASDSPIGPIDGAALQESELRRRAGLLQQAGVADATSQTLVLAADQFVVQRASTSTRSVIAGYPWFTDWGRDTMIALPGLTLATRRYDLARELLQTFAAYEQDGLIPNCFPEEGGEPLYNTADASLWFFEAAWLYLKESGDERFVREQLYPVLTRIAQAHLQGTHFDIRVTGEGLLRCGNPHVQVTWMDAKVGDWVVTPRDGYPVEIQALWHNALQVLAALAGRWGESTAAATWAEAAARVQAGFDRFWNAQDGCCYDLIKADGRADPAIRPNQLFAITLSHPLLTGARARQAVQTVYRELWTPYGLRSLSPRDPAYRGRYLGSRRERDSAYHQGTVWAWLAGPFVRAFLATHSRSPANLAHARGLLEPLRAHLQEFGLGSVAENFDGDPPHLPRACVAQAWSVAELLRAWREVQ